MKKLIAKTILGVAQAIGSGPLNILRGILPISVKLAMSRLVTKNLKSVGLTVQAGNGLKFVSIRDTVFLHVLVEGYYEKSISSITSKLIHKGDIAVDIGANFGWYTMLLADSVGDDGKVHSFEPNPTMYDVLARNIELNNFQRRVISKLVGVGEKRDTLPFAAVEGENGLGRVVSNDEVKSARVEVKTIKVEALNELLSHEIGKIAFIKMDVEGYEPFVVLGGKKIFECTSPPILQVEINSEALLTRGHQVARDFIEYLNQMNAKIYEGQTGKLVRIDRLMLGKNADLFIFPNVGKFSDRAPD